MKKVPSAAACLPSVPQTILPVSWSDTIVRYLWWRRHEISSTPDLDQIRESVEVEFVGDDPAADRADGAPGDAVERRTVDLSVLVASHTARSSKSRVNPDPGAGEVHRLDQHPVLGAPQSPAAHREHTDASAQVEVPPRRVHLPGVVTMKVE